MKYEEKAANYPLDTGNDDISITINMRIFPILKIEAESLLRISLALGRWFFSDVKSNS